MKRSCPVSARAVVISVLAFVVSLSACKDSSEPTFGQYTGTSDAFGRWWGTWEGIHAGVWFGEEVLGEPLTLTLKPCKHGKGVAISSSLSWGFRVPGLFETGSVQLAGCSAESADATIAVLTDRTFKAVVQRGTLRWTFLGTHFGHEILGDLFLELEQPDGSFERRGASDFAVGKPATT